MANEANKRRSEVIEDLQQICYCAGPTCSGCEVNIAKIAGRVWDQATAYYRELAESGFNKQAAEEGAGILEGSNESPRYEFMLGAHWQFSRDQIALSEAEEFRRETARSAVVLLDAKDAEIAKLKAQLGER